MIELDQWPQNDKHLLSWFVKTGKHSLPKTPWKLFEWLTINDNDKFIRHIENGIKFGPGRSHGKDSYYKGIIQLYPSTTRHVRKLKFLINGIVPFPK